MPMQVVFCYKNGDKIKSGMETIIAAENMVLNTSKLIRLN
jgi:hypothetical protein